MQLWRCDFCTNETTDKYEAGWLWLQWYMGEKSSDIFQRYECRSWLFCSPACVSHFAELESVQGESA